MASEDHAEGFPPICGTAPRILILGSMPGKASLEKAQYYGHPQNRFWPLMQALAGIDASMNYNNRCEALCSANIALWDVIGSCERPGSLDSDIRDESIVINDIASLVSQNPSIRHIACNGKKAYQLFQQHSAHAVLSSKVEVSALPSTSPANAKWRLEDLIKSWQVIFQASQ